VLTRRPHAVKKKKRRPFVKKFDSLLCSKLPWIETFIGEFTKISNPYVYFEEWATTFRSLLKEGNLRDRIESYQLMFERVFAIYEPGSPKPPSNVGRLHWKFAKKYRADIEEQFGGSVGGNLSEIDRREFESRIKFVLNRPATKYEYKSTKLRDYSPWLSGYKSQDHYNIEIPGQYSGRCKPDVSNHKLIVGFQDDVVVMSSIRQPCKITINASDENKYHYLVKCGEDLRQDQRIETMFGSFNDVITNDAYLRCKPDCKILTYQVIPLNSRVGVIEWVNKTKTFKQLILEHANRTDCTDILDQVQSKYIPSKLHQYADSLNRYGHLVKMVTKGKQAQRFKSLQENIPKDILRNAFMQMSFDIRSFFTLRSSFVTSYSTMMISNWLLGIGDRHCDNILVSMESGRTLGIDFGHAFGSATEVLPVPEIVPFRLTNQIIGMTSPYDAVTGQMGETMRRVLNVFIENTRHLVAVSNIFLNDPSVEWNIDRNINKIRMNEEKGEKANIPNKIWYARKKMNIVKMKLNGVHPTKITCDEIESNMGIPPEFKSEYLRVAQGLSPDQGRSSFDEDAKLSPDDQITCLIDQATDVSVLSCAFVGWRSWL